MKKFFLSAIGIFALSLMFSLNYQSDVIVENNAFADGTCCKELQSICGLNGENFTDKYYKSTGSCKPAPVIEGFN